MEFLIIAALIYLAFHVGHAHAKYRAYHKHNRLFRIWLSIPGPFGTRISKRL